MKNLYNHLSILFCTCSLSSQIIIINETSVDSVFVYEDFDIADNNLRNNDNGVSGVGWSNRWSYMPSTENQYNINVSSLMYPSSSNTFSSGRHIFSPINSEMTIERSLLNSYELLNTSFYFSFLAKKNINGSFSIEGYGGTFKRYGMRVGLLGEIEARASTSWGTKSPTDTFKNNITYLVVLAKQGNDNKVAIYKEGDIIPTSIDDVNWEVITTGRTGVNLDKIQIITKGEINIDELRLGSTFRSVTQDNTWNIDIQKPSNLSVNPSSIDVESIENTIVLNWKDNADNEIGYKIYMDGQEVADIGANSSENEITQIFSNFNYYFAVAAYNANGISAKTNIGKLVVNNPSHLNLDQPLNGSILYQTIPHFSWSHQSSNPLEGNFEIIIDDNSDFSSPVDNDTVPAFINYYSTNFELDHDIVYYWKVRYIDKNNLPSNWSIMYSFTISPPELTIDIVETDNWDGIKSKLASALQASTTTSGAVELRFPINGIFNLQQDPNSNESDRSNGFLLYIDGYDDIIINGRGSKVIIEATHGEWICGFIELGNADGIQVKDIIIDYHKNSLYQIGGVIQNFDKNTRTFEVVVDTDVYDTYEVLKNYNDGYFLSKEHQQKIGRLGVDFTMEQTWEQAKINDSTYRFTCGASEYGRYRDELENGDYFVLSHRGGDIMYLRSDVNNFVVNNLTTHACRGRFFSIDPGSSNIRSINNNYIRTQGRIMGSSSGGVGADRGNNVWYEGNRFEYTRDDMFHSGSNAGKGSVFRDNYLIGAYRNSIWVKADRSWISNNTIMYSGQSGVQIGYAPSTPGTMADVVLVENNHIIQPYWYGIETDSNPSNPDFETGSFYSENVIIRNNTIENNLRDEGLRLDYLKNAVIENNIVKSNIDYWSIYSEENLEYGIHVMNSESVSGCGNKILDSRIENENILFIGTNTTNVNICTPETLSVKQEFYEKKNKAYPNPSHTGIFNLSYKSDYQVYSFDGKLVGFFKNTNIIDISKLKSGMYLLYDKNKKTTTKLLW